MQKLEGICQYCLGCKKLEILEFKGVHRCKNYVPSQIDWQEYYYEELKKKWANTETLRSK